MHVWGVTKCFYIEFLRSTMKEIYRRISRYARWGAFYDNNKYIICFEAFASFLRHICYAFGFSAAAARRLHGVL